MKIKHLLFTMLVNLIALNGCSQPISQADAQATADVAGCWPGNGATPRPITVTPEAIGASPMLSATSTILPGTPGSTLGPALTQLPTTTPYPRCTPGPGETQIAYPTPVPPGRPYPTQEPLLRQGGSDQQTSIHVPGLALRLDLAVHPTEGWPAVAVLQRFIESTDPMQAFVRVFNPHTQQWGSAQQLDIGEASSGRDRFGGVAIGITGDRTVHVVWGASDAIVDAGGQLLKQGQLWMSKSNDYGKTWSRPQPIADHCWLVQDLATTADGYLVVLGHCYVWAGGDALPRAGLLVRHPDGSWEAPASLSMGTHFGNVVIAGEGASAIVTALVSDIRDPFTVYLLARRLAGEDTWAIATRQIPPPSDPGAVMEGYAWYPQGLVFPYQQPDGTTTSGIIFTWTPGERQGAFALTSLDAGASWGQVEPLPPAPPIDIAPEREFSFAAPAYDPAAQRLLILWTCCADTRFGQGRATHVASWSTPGSGRWAPLTSPVITGARVAGMTVTGQAANGRVIWLGWIEQGQQVEVRSINLNQLVPVQVYPKPTTFSSPTMEGGIQ